MMLRRDDPQFKALVDRAVGQVMKSGEIDKIYAKWFTSNDSAAEHQPQLPDDAAASRKRSPIRTTAASSSRAPFRRFRGGRKPPGFRPLVFSGNLRCIVGGQGSTRGGAACSTTGDMQGGLPLFVRRLVSSALGSRGAITVDRKQA